MLAFSGLIITVPFSALVSASPPCASSTQLSFAEPVLGECSLLYGIPLSFYFIIRDASAAIRTIVTLEFSPEAWTEELDAFPLIFLVGFAGAGVWLAYMVMAMIFPMFGGILEWILMGKVMDGEGDNILDRMRFCFGSWWLLNMFVPPIWKEVEWTEWAVQGIITRPFRSET
ncbi:unnamed protein product, partial [Mesorhabditis belari]|uniref:Uncharacterized protein n=1 Tax=Mesorhabditis belari TaxID=2138241 RepID=A0AAF3FCN9_9BILA